MTEAVPVTAGTAWTGACGLKRWHWMMALCLIGLAACTEMGYVKPGVTEEEYIADSEACLELARVQAARDVSLFRFRTTWGSAYDYDRYSWRMRGVPPSYSALEFRYRQLCMFSRGYELAPLDQEPASDGPEADQDGDEESDREGDQEGD